MVALWLRPGDPIERAAAGLRRSGRATAQRQRAGSRFAAGIRRRACGGQATRRCARALGRIERWSSWQARL